MIGKFFGVKTIEAAMASFSKAINDLQEVEQAHRTFGNEKLELAKSYTEEAGAHYAEVDRAVAIKEKLMALFGGETELEIVEEVPLTDIAEQNSAEEKV